MAEQNNLSVPDPGQRSWLARLEPYEERDFNARKFSLGSFLRLTREHRMRILVCAVVGLVAAAALAFLWPRSYRAETLVAPVSDVDDPSSALVLGNRFSGLAGLVGFNVGTNDTGREESLAQLRSRAFTLAYIRDEDLMPVLFAKKWDPQRKSWRGEPPTEEDAYQLFDRKVRSVEEDRRTGLVTIAVEWRERELAARWANRIVERANAAGRERVMKEAASSLRFLEGEFNRTQTIEIRQAIYALVEAQKKKQMLASVRPEYSFRVIDPARVPDEDRFNQPKRALLILAGLFGGLFVGLLVAVTAGLRENSAAVAKRPVP